MIVFPSKEFKYYKWKKELEKVGEEAYAFETPNIFHFIELLKLVIKGKTINSYIFRYLNDRPNFISSFLRLIGDVLTIIFCKIFQIKILWILHNVDKESTQFYPSIIKWRRGILNVFASKIFVTDKLLINIAVNHKIKKEKLDYISFGFSKHNIDINESLRVGELLSSFRKDLLGKHSPKKINIGICISSNLSKFKHFETVIDFVNSINRISKDELFAVFLYGILPSSLNSLNLKSAYENNIFIHYEEESKMIDEVYFKNEFDYVYRCLTDFSVPFSLYPSIYLEKPIITHNFGFLEQMVNYYNLGFVYDLNSPKKIDFEKWDPKFSRDFMEDKGWNSSALKLLNSSK